MVDGQPLQSLLGDVALAATAVLHQKAMKELGMPAVELHPKVAFLIDNVGYPAARNDDRIKAQSLADRGSMAKRCVPIAVPENQAATSEALFANRD